MPWSSSKAALCISRRPRHRVVVELSWVWPASQSFVGDGDVRVLGSRTTPILKRSLEAALGCGTFHHHPLTTLTVASHTLSGFSSLQSIPDTSGALHPHGTRPHVCDTLLPRFFPLQRLVNRGEPPTPRNIPSCELHCALRVSHPLDALLPPRSAGLVPSRFRSWGFPFEALFPPRCRRPSRAPPPSWSFLGR